MQKRRLKLKAMQTVGMEIFKLYLKMPPYSLFDYSARELEEKRKEKKITQKRLSSAITSQLTLINAGWDKLHSFNIFPKLYLSYILIFYFLFGVGLSLLKTLEFLQYILSQTKSVPTLVCYLTMCNCCDK